MAFTGTLSTSTLSAQGQITKGADADASVDLAHGLVTVPLIALVVAVSGTEAAWLVTAMDTTNITLTASTTGGTAASVCNVVVLKSLHSVIQ